MDDKEWKSVYQAVDEHKSDGQWTSVSFDPAKARFLKFVITKTASDDSPAISEIFVANINSQVDPDEVLYFEENPSFILKNPAQWNRLSNLWNKIFKIDVSWLTNKNDQYNQHASIGAMPDGNWNKYEFVLPAGGTQLEDLNFSTNISSQLEIRNLQTKNLSLGELKQRNLIKRFSEN